MNGAGLLEESALSACIFSLGPLKCSSFEAAMLFMIRLHRQSPLPCSVANSRHSFYKLLLTILVELCVLIPLLTLSNEAAYAGWVLTSGDDEAGLTVYVDPDSIRRKGDLVKMWQLYDYKTIQTVAGDSLLSIKRYNEFDCTEERRTRMRAYTWFAGNMGTGKVVYSTTDEQQWEPVVPRSINHTLWKVACGKK